VIKEVLRVAPPSGTVLRRTLADMEVRGVGGGGADRAVEGEEVACCGGFILM
jgi:hypothetical protein